MQPYHTQVGYVSNDYRQHDGWAAPWLISKSPVYPSVQDVPIMSIVAKLLRAIQMQMEDVKADSTPCRQITLDYQEHPSGQGPNYVIDDSGPTMPTFLPAMINTRLHQGTS
jgi:hypothetical protein